MLLLSSITGIDIEVHEVIIRNIFKLMQHSFFRLAVAHQIEGRERSLNFVLILSKFTFAVLKINPLGRTR